MTSALYPSLREQRVQLARVLAQLWHDDGPRGWLLLDEPTSALDPIATTRIEELVNELKEKVTILIVTHNMQQAARVSDRTAFMHLGVIVEEGPTDQIFTNPKHEMTERYVEGRFG